MVSDGQFLCANTPPLDFLRSLFNTPTLSGKLVINGHEVAVFNSKDPAEIAWGKSKVCGFCLAVVVGLSSFGKTSRRWLKFGS